MYVYGTGMNCCPAPTQNRWSAALPRLRKGIGPLVFACTQRSNALRRRSSPPRWLNMRSNIWNSVQACEVFCVLNWIDNTKLKSCFCKSSQMINSTKPEKDMSKYESCGTFLFERCCIINLVYNRHLSGVCKTNSTSHQAENMACIGRQSVELRYTKMKVIQPYLQSLQWLKVHQPSGPIFCKFVPYIGQLRCLIKGKVKVLIFLFHSFPRMWGHSHGRIMTSPTGVATLKSNKTGQKQPFWSNIRW